MEERRVQSVAFQAFPYNSSPSCDFVGATLHLTFHFTIIAQYNSVPERRLSCVSINSVHRQQTSYLIARSRHYLTIRWIFARKYFIEILILRLLNPLFTRQARRICVLLSFSSHASYAEYEGLPFIETDRYRPLEDCPIRLRGHFHRTYQTRCSNFFCDYTRTDSL